MQTYISVILAEIIKAIAAVIYQLDIFQATFTGPAATLALGTSGVLQSVSDMLSRVRISENNEVQRPHENDKIIHILCQQRKKLVAIKFFRALPLVQREKLLADYNLYFVSGIEENGLAAGKAAVERIERDFDRI
jgi:hypothetical protein